MPVTLLPSKPLALAQRSTGERLPQSVGGNERPVRRDTAETFVLMGGRLAFSAAEDVREAVLAGLGIAIVSEWMMARELADGSVVPVFRQWRLPEMELWAVFPAGRLPSAKARAFISWFGAQIKI